MEDEAVQLVKINEHGRRIGESHPKASLSDHEVELLIELLIFRDDKIEEMLDRGCTQAEIDAMLREEQLSYSGLAEKFEVHKQAVAKIARGERRCQRPSRFKPVPMKREG